MQAEGLSLEQCIRILRAGSPQQDSAADKRRAWDRERKAEKRAEAKALSGGMSGGNPPDPSPNEIDILTPTREEKPEPKGSVKKFILPADIPAEPWVAWVEMRRRIRKNPTDHAKTLAVSELRRLRDEEGWPPGDVLNHCTMNSYQGIFPPKRGQNERSDRDPTTVALERLLGDVGTNARTG
jgi:hypothetical protein